MFFVVSLVSMIGRLHIVEALKGRRALHLVLLCESTRTDDSNVLHTSSFLIFTVDGSLSHVALLVTKLLLITALRILNDAQETQDNYKHDNHKNRHD